MYPQTSTNRSSVSGASTWSLRRDHQDYGSYTQVSPSQGNTFGPNSRPRQSLGPSSVPNMHNRYDLARPSIDLRQMVPEDTPVMYASTHSYNNLPSTFSELPQSYRDSMTLGYPKASPHMSMPLSRTHHDQARSNQLVSTRIIASPPRHSTGSTTSLRNNGVLHLGTPIHQVTTDFQFFPNQPTPPTRPDNDSVHIYSSPNAPNQYHVQQPHSGALTHAHNNQSPTYYNYDHHHVTPSAVHGIHQNQSTTGTIEANQASSHSSRPHLTSVSRNCASHSDAFYDSRVISQVNPASSGTPVTIQSNVTKNSGPRKVSPMMSLIIRARLVYQEIEDYALPLPNVICRPPEVQLRSSIKRRAKPPNTPELIARDLRGRSPVLQPPEVEYNYVEPKITDIKFCPDALTRFFDHNAMIGDHVREITEALQPPAAGGDFSSSSSPSSSMSFEVLVHQNEVPEQPLPKVDGPSSQVYTETRRHGDEQHSRHSLTPGPAPVVGHFMTTSVPSESQVSKSLEHNNTVPTVVPAHESERPVISTRQPDALRVDKRISSSSEWIQPEGGTMRREDITASPVDDDSSEDSLTSSDEDSSTDSDYDEVENETSGIVKAVPVVEPVALPLVQTMRRQSREPRRVSASRVEPDSKKSVVQMSRPSLPAMGYMSGPREHVPVRHPQVTYQAKVIQSTTPESAEIHKQQDTKDDHSYRTHRRSTTPSVSYSRIPPSGSVSRPPNTTPRSVSTATQSNGTRTYSQPFYQHRPSGTTNTQVGMHTHTSPKRNVSVESNVIRTTHIQQQTPSQYQPQYQPQLARSCSQISRQSTTHPSARFVNIPQKSTMQAPSTPNLYYRAPSAQQMSSRGSVLSMQSNASIQHQGSIQSIQSVYSNLGKVHDSKCTTSADARYQLQDTVELPRSAQNSALSTSTGYEYSGRGAIAKLGSRDLGNKEVYQTGYEHSSGSRTQVLDASSQSLQKPSKSKRRRRRDHEESQPNDDTDRSILTKLIGVFR